MLPSASASWDNSQRHGLLLSVPLSEEGATSQELARRRLEAHQMPLERPRPRVHLAEEASLARQLNHRRRRRWLPPASQVPMMPLPRLVWQ